MGRRSTARGVYNDRGRCRIEIKYQGQRIKKTLQVQYTKSGIEAAVRLKADIDRRIGAGTFNFADEFPEYKHLDKLGAAPRERQTFRALGDVFIECMEGIAHSTTKGYRNILRNFWYPKIGDRYVDEIVYSDLKRIMAKEPWGAVKTRNNYLSVLKRVFALARADELIKTDPTGLLKSVKVQRDPPDPFTVDEAEAIIETVRKRFGEHAADYVEWQFFTGCRPSETIAIQWAQVDLQKRTVLITRARVYGQDKQTTKTRRARTLELCPRAYAVLLRQRAVSQLAGKEVFLREGTDRWHDIQVQGKQWNAAFEHLTIRRRGPYQTRHSFVTWNLMIGKNIVWVAKQHGHSVVMTSEVYDTWLDGSTPEDVARIKAAMENSEFVRTLSAEVGGGIQVV